MLSISKIQEVLENCFVFDQVQKLRKSRRIVSLLILLSSKIEVSQNCFVFDAVKFQN